MHARHVEVCIIIQNEIGFGGGGEILPVCRSDYNCLISRIIFPGQVGNARI